MNRNVPAYFADKDRVSMGKLCLQSTFFCLWFQFLLFYRFLWSRCSTLFIEIYSISIQDKFTETIDNPESKSETWTFVAVNRIAKKTRPEVSVALHQGYATQAAYNSMQYISWLCSCRFHISTLFLPCHRIYGTYIHWQN